jgi:hypothetical protein
LIRAPCLTSQTPCAYTMSIYPVIFKPLLISEITLFLLTERYFLSLFFFLQVTSCWASLSVVHRCLSPYHVPSSCHRPGLIVLLLIITYPAFFFAKIPDFSICQNLWLMTTVARDTSSLHFVTQAVSLSQSYQQQKINKNKMYSIP